ncbi:hypothetical protein KC19_4G161600, partial [Ceratodon purpureus]
MQPSAGQPNPKTKRGKATPEEILVADNRNQARLECNPVALHLAMALAPLYEPLPPLALPFTDQRRRIHLS